MSFATILVARAALPASEIAVFGRPEVNARLTLVYRGIGDLADWLVIDSTDNKRYPSITIANLPTPRLNRFKSSGRKKRFLAPLKNGHLFHRCTIPSSRGMFRSEAFCSDRGLGKVALAALALGVFMTSHVSLLLYVKLVALPDPSIGPTAVLRWRCLEQWGFYALALGFFHLMEFLLTAAYRPTKVSYECM